MSIKGTLPYFELRLGTQSVKVQKLLVIAGDPVIVVKLIML